MDGGSLSMLEGVPPVEADHQIYRFAAPINFDRMLDEMGIVADDIDEILQFLGESRGGANGERLVEAPFTPKPQLEARKNTSTRFSDGNLRVFYSSLEAETAEMEVMHWYAGAAVGGSARVAYYNQLRCRFRGAAADLRRKERAWSFLIEDGDEAYSRCQALAREAVELNIAGFLTPSARRASGTNVPVFRRQSLSEPEILRVVAFSRQDSTGEVVVRRG
jgi:RES domain